MTRRPPGADELAPEFISHRPRLLGIAYRMLGSMWDAEDTVDDAMVRGSTSTGTQIREPAAFLTTMVTRRALDQLRSARVARERYIGPWLPEPVATNPSPLDPLDTVERRESVSLATLRMMEQLTPPERAVFVLHEAFDLPHERLPLSWTSARRDPGSTFIAPGPTSGTRTDVDRPMPLPMASCLSAC